MCTNERRALTYHASYNGCDARTHTEFAHNRARPAASHFASSADHVLLLTINLTLCGHTLYEYTFVVEEPSLAQLSPGLHVLFAFQHQIALCFVKHYQVVRPSLEIPHIRLFAVRTGDFQTAWREARAELRFPQTARAFQHQETAPKHIVFVLC